MILTNWNKKTSLKLSALGDLKQKITVYINDRGTVEDLKGQKVDIFAEKDTDTGKTNTIMMTSDTGNHPPIKLRPYRPPFSKHPIVDKTVNDMLAANIICPSGSPWSFLIVVVDKKDGTKRLCTDFKKLNNISKKSLATSSN